MARRKNNRASKHRRLMTENLEDRKLMAGDVTVSVVNGDLVVEGDNRSNEVLIWQASPGSQTWLVQGKYEAGGYTRVNGHYGISAMFGVTDDVRIDMNKGNDKVTIKNGVVRDDMSIRGDEGRDTILAMDMVIRDDLYIYGDKSSRGYDDNIQVWRTEVRDNAKIRTYGGADDVILAGLTVRDDLRLETGSGRDSVDLVGSSVDRFYGDLGSSNDKLHTNESRFNRFELNGGSGYDELLDGDSVRYGKRTLRSLRFRHV